MTKPNSIDVVANICFMVHRKKKMKLRPHKLKRDVEHVL